MKRFLSFAMAAVLLMVGCAKDNDSLNAGGETVAVTFSTTLPIEVSRTVGDGSQANVLNYAIYDANGVLFANYPYENDVQVSGNKATVTLDLVKGQTYKVAFWAQNENAPYTFDRTAGTVTVSYDDKELSNDETYDAFYVLEPIEVTGPAVKNVVLRRPFAQINLGATKADVEAAKALGVEIDKSMVTLTNVYQTLNLYSGVASNPTTATVAFNYNALPGNDLNVQGTDYAYIAANYILANGEADVTELTFSVKDGDNEINKDVVVPSVNYKRNYRTNILGRLLTSAVDFNIVIDGTPEGDISSTWDGELVKPIYDDATKTYYISNAGALAWLSNAVNGTLPAEMRSGETAPAISIEGCNIVLSCDIDFGGLELTPIKSALNITFDGQGNTIRNIAYGLGAEYSAMFEGASGTFKNINFENVKAVNEDNNRASAFLGGFYGGTVENVHVKDVEVKGSQKLSGLISLIDGSVTISHCSVENFKASVSATDQDGGFVQAGGMVGYIKTLKATISFENCEVKGDIILNGETDIYPTDDDMWGYYSGSFVGSMGSRATVAADVSTINFNGCKTVAVQSSPALMVSPRAGEFWGDRITLGFDYLTNAPMIVNIDGEEQVYKTESQKALEAAIEQGGEIKLEEDVVITTPVVIAEDADVTIDLNGKTISLNKAIYADENGNAVKENVIVNNGTLEIVGGTISPLGVNGGSAIMNNGTLTISNATLKGAPCDDNVNVNGVYWASYAVNHYGESLTLNNVEIVSNHGAISLYGDAVINDCNVTMNGRGGSAHVFYVGGDGTEVVINSGDYTHKGNTDGSLGYIMTGATVTVNGGTFSASNGGYGFATYTGALNINGGTFNSMPLNWGGPISIKGGTFNAQPTAAWVADGYKAMQYNGKWVVVEDTVEAVASNATELADAIANGSENVVMSGDVEWNQDIQNDATIDLGGNTFEATYSYELKNDADLTMVGGDYVMNGTFGHIDARPSTAEGSVLLFEDMNFINNKKDKTWGNTTNRLNKVLQITPSVLGAKAVAKFVNCTFENASVYIAGMSGKNANFEVVFENCTFNALTSSAPIEVQNYMTGSIKLVDCTFNLTCTSSTATAVSVTMNSSTVDIIAENNKFNAVAATPYTYDASKGETEADNVKVNGTPANVKFIYVNPGSSSTVTETGTVKTGIAL